MDSNNLAVAAFTVSGKKDAPFSLVCIWQRHHGKIVYWCLTHILISGRHLTLMSKPAFLLRARLHRPLQKCFTFLSKPNWQVLTVGNLPSLGMERGPFLVLFSRDLLTFLPVSSFHILFPDSVK